MSIHSCSVLSVIGQMHVDELNEIADEFCARLLANSTRDVDAPSSEDDPASLKNVVGAWVYSLWKDAEEHDEQFGQTVHVVMPQALHALPAKALLEGLMLLRRRWTALVLRTAGELTGLAGVVSAIEWSVDRQVLAVHDSCLDVMNQRIGANERLATVGQLAASVGHELRNPLATIENSAFLLEQRLNKRGLDDAGAFTLVERIRRQVQVSAQIVEDVLALAKERPLRRKPHHLKSLAEAVCAEIQVPEGVAIGVAIPEGLQAWIDVSLIQLVLQNLVRNAMQAVTPLGKIEVTACASDDGLVITVRDDGPGVPIADRLSIFEPLFTTKADGHGLGLSLCRRIAVAHGGSLELQSADNGATFRLWLPGPKAES